MISQFLSVDDYRLFQKSDFLSPCRLTIFDQILIIILHFLGIPQVIEKV
jgi:hypothetical protein